MYGEIDSVECGSFETHLAECTRCTDDFAAISNARFSVFEWRKQEFDRLATPIISIPALAKSPISAGAELGWFGTLAGLLAFVRSPMVVATALLVCLGVGFIAVSYFRSSESLIATGSEVEVPTIADDNATDKKKVGESIIDVAPQIDVREPVQVAASNKQAPSSYRRSQNRVVRRAVNGNPKRSESPQLARKPVLNDFNDDTDDSLRLSVLLDEIGG